MVFLKHRYELIIDTHRKNAGNAGPDTDYVDMLYFAETLYYRLESVRRKSKRVSSGDQNIADLLVGADIIQFFIEFFDSRTAVALAIYRTATAGRGSFMGGSTLRTASLQEGGPCRGTGELCAALPRNRLHLRGHAYHRGRARAPLMILYTAF